MTQRLPLRNAQRKKAFSQESDCMGKASVIILCAETPGGFNRHLMTSQGMTSFSLQAQPFTVILFGGPASLSPPSLWTAALGWVSTFLGLLCLRIADDLASLENDKVAHPDRGLPSGRINAGNLRTFVAAGTILFYILYFKSFKKRLPLIIRAPWSNAIFAVIPCYVGLLSPNFVTPQVFLAGVVWLAAVAHEWAHNVHGPDETGLGLAGYVQAIGSRQSAAVALALFAGAAFFACLAWLTMGRPWVFGMLFVMTSLHVGFLGMRLIRQPEYKNAQPFYIVGFTFLLLPLAGLLLKGVFG
jgi:hypothetical protein